MNTWEWRPTPALLERAAVLDDDTLGPQPARRQQVTILSLGNVFYRWGALIVPPGYTDPAV